MIMSRFCLVLILLLPVSVKAQMDPPMPFTSFTPITVNLDFPQYRVLRNDGGMVEIEGGLRGLILYRENEETFIAYERNCPHNPEESCARVDIDMSRIFLIDRCCGSTFSASDGYPMKGPATRPLRRYKTQFSGTTVTITDEMVD
jgi:nitrite reductase/ring-hydroxylating ferredoxin subunit